MIKDSSVSLPKSNSDNRNRSISLHTSKEFYSVKELASLLNVNPMTIYRIAHRGQITCYQIGRAKRFHRNDVEVFLDGCVVNNQEDI